MAPKAGVELGVPNRDGVAPKAGVLEAPNAGVDEPNAGVVEPNSPVDPNAGAGVALSPHHHINSHDLIYVIITEAM